VDDTPCRQFFLQPAQTLHRHYEVLRAFFVEGCTQAAIAERFGLTAATVQSLVRDFRAQVRAGQVSPFFSSPAADDLPAPAPAARCRRRLRSPTAGGSD
jgi:hypothetical protein